MNTAEKVEPNNLRNRGRDDDATLAEVAHLCRVVGSIDWVARQCRPDLQLQTAVRKAQVKQLLTAIRMVRDCVVCSYRGLRCPSGQIRWVDLPLVHASFAGEEAIVYGQKEPLRMGRRSHSDRSADGCV